TISEFGPRIRNGIVVAALAGCIALFALQFADTMRHFREPPAQAGLVGALRDEVATHPNLRVLCDDPITRVLSKLPAETFVTSDELRGGSDQVAEEIDGMHVGFIVMSNMRTPATVNALGADLGPGAKMPSCRRVAQSGPDSSGLQLWLCRFEPM
ncbi:MAG TPA: hypothetical protein VI756_19990, partial [Blastocatellia bacterium]